MCFRMRISFRRKKERSTGDAEPRSASDRRSSTTTTGTRSGSGSGSSFPTTTTTTTTASSSSSNSKATSLSLESLRSSLPQNPQIYSFSDISSATEGLRSTSPKQTSWRCSLRGRDVVVFQHRMRRQIDLPHLLSSLCKCHHSSIADLLGAALAGDHVYLVYEYVPGASLSDCLRNPKNPAYTPLPSWISRMRVATDIADGLLYIHNQSGIGFRPIHNHINSSSVIVSDPSLRAKICQFGAAEFTGELPEELKLETGEIVQDSSHPSSTKTKLVRSGSGRMRMQGTKGYMSPEFLAAGTVSQKTDVYAFGVVLLEILSGEEPVKYIIDDGSEDYRRVSLIDRAAETLKEGGLRRWVDRRLRDSFPVEEAEKVTRVALDCVHNDPEKRPHMETVAGTLSKMLLASERWAAEIRVPTDFSVSMAPR